MRNLGLMLWELDMDSQLPVLNTCYDFIDSVTVYQF